MKLINLSWKKIIKIKNNIIIGSATQKTIILTDL